MTFGSVPAAVVMRRSYRIVLPSLLLRMFRALVMSVLHVVTKC